MLSKLLKSIGILFFLSGVLRLHGQTAIQFEKAADQAFHAKDFYSSFLYYKESLKRKVKEEVKLKLAIAAFEYGAVDLANDVISELLADNASQRFETIELYSGFCLFAKGDYYGAKQAMNKYITKAWHNKKKSNIDLAKQYIEKCASAIYYSGLAGPDPLTDWAYSLELNSKKADFAYSEFEANRFFSSTRKNAIIHINEAAEFSYLRPRGLARNQEVVFFENLNESEAITCICTSINKLDRRCKLMLWDLITNQLDDLGPLFNQDSISVSQPYVDHVNQLLYFSSDGFESKGGKDIYYISLDSLNSPSIPKALSINSSYNEESPFVSDGVLYFSSDRDQGLGGYDIYRLTLDAQSIAVNMGAAYNSSYDENYYRSYDSVEYLSSNRAINGSKSIDDVNCLNIYKRLPSEPIEDLKLISFQEDLAKINTSYDIERTREIEQEPDLNNEPDHSVILVDEEVLEDYKATVYFPNNIPVQTDTAYNYSNCFEVYEDLINYYLNSCPEMDDFESFYAAEVIAGLKALDKLRLAAIEYLDLGKSVMIEIDAFTSPRASSNYNMLLGKRRCEAVYNYIFERDKNISKYMGLGAVIINCNSFGEERTPTGVSSDFLDTMASVYSIAASKERRVECRLVVDL